MSCKYEGCSRNPEQDSNHCIFHMPAGEKDEKGLWEECMRRFESLLDNGEDRGEYQGFVLMDLDLSGKAYWKMLDFSNAEFHGNTVFSTLVEKTIFQSSMNVGGATFSGEVHFSGAAFSKGAFFRGTIFREKVYFRGTMFSDRTYFRGAVFNKAADLSYTSFSRVADFSYSIFSKTVDFNYANYSEWVYFTGTIFSGKAHFQSVTFSEDAYFRSAAFHERANFPDVIFSKVYFSKATFSKKANFINAIFSEKAYFSHTTFSGAVDFRNATLSKAYFSGAIFSRSSNFSGVAFSKETDFSFTTFSKAADFTNAIFSQTVDFSNSDFLKGGTFRKCRITQGTFEYANINRVSFKEVVLNNIAFEGARMEFSYLADAIWRVPEEKHRPTLGDLLPKENTQYRMREEEEIPEEIFPKDKRKEKRKGKGKEEGEGKRKEKRKERQEALLKAAATYRNIKYSLNNEGAYDKAGIFFIREREMQREIYRNARRTWGECRDGVEKKYEIGERSSPLRIKVSILLFLLSLKDYLGPRVRYMVETAYFWFGQYGERPLMLFAWASILICIYAIVYFVADMYFIPLEGISPGDGILNYLYFSIVTFTTLGFGDIWPGHLLLRLIAASEAFLGAFIMAYFVVSWARKLMR